MAAQEEDVDDGQGQVPQSLEQIGQWMQAGRNAIENDMTTMTGLEEEGVAYTPCALQDWINSVDKSRKDVQKWVEQNQLDVTRYLGLNDIEGGLPGYERTAKNVSHPGEVICNAVRNYTQTNMVQSAFLKGQLVERENWDEVCMFCHSIECDNNCITDDEVGERTFDILRAVGGQEFCDVFIADLARSAKKEDRLSGKKMKGRNKYGTGKTKGKKKRR